MAQRVGTQPGNVHLGDAEPLADLRLRHAAAKVHQQDLLLTRGQLAPVRGDGLHAEHVLQPRILRTEIVSQGAHGGLAGQRRVQRVRREGQLRPLGLPQVIPADPQMPGQVGSGRRTAQFPGPAARSPHGLPGPAPAPGA